jgi:hypothetical protein
MESGDAVVINRHSKEGLTTISLQLLIVLKDRFHSLSLGRESESDFARFSFQHLITFHYLKLCNNKHRTQPTMPRFRFLQLPTVQITARFRFRNFRSLSSRVSILENEDLLQQIPLQDVRNWCFIAHIDHGKSVRTQRIREHLVALLLSHF